MHICGGLLISGIEMAGLVVGSSTYLCVLVVMIGMVGVLDVAHYCLIMNSGNTRVVLFYMRKWAFTTWNVFFSARNHYEITIVGSRDCIEDIAGYGRIVRLFQDTDER